MLPVPPSSSLRSLFIHLCLLLLVLCPPPPLNSITPLPVYLPLGERVRVSAVFVCAAEQTWIGSLELIARSAPRPVRHVIHAEPAGCCTSYVYVCIKLFQSKLFQNKEFSKLYTAMSVCVMHLGKTD